MEANARPDGFRLTVLNPGGRDPEQSFARGPEPPSAAGHAPVNFHGYAACTHGSFHRSTARATAEQTPVLLLLRGDFKETHRALKELKAAGRAVAVSLKETGLHQIAEQLSDPKKLALFREIIRAADGCIGATQEATHFYASCNGHGPVEFIPTPYPIDEARWNFAVPLEERAGIFIGTREWDVPSRNHLAALLLARRLSEEEADAAVTVYNKEGRKGARLLAELAFKPGKLRVLDEYTAYADYLREMARHRVVLQLDRSSVPGQVAGDALLCRVPCVGGNGAVDRIAFSDAADFDEIHRIAAALLRDDEFCRRASAEAERRATEKLSFSVVAAQLERFFAALAAP